MLRSFHIENFKSLTDFTMSDMGQFVCLIGMNGAGKTTVLHALDFMAHLSLGTVDIWLEKQNWTRHDLISKLLNSPLIVFRLTFDFGRTVVWEGMYDVLVGRCVEEKIFAEGSDEWFVELSVDRVSFGVSTGVQHFNVANINFKDSVISLIRPAENSDSPTAQIIPFMGGIRSLDLLDPYRMRQKSWASKSLGQGGKNLTGYLHNLNEQQKQELLTEIQRFYPQLSRLRTFADSAGLSQVYATENRLAQNSEMPAKIELDATHLNDGLLRVLTVVAQTKTSHKFLLFDEIENGINPEKIGELVNYLLDAKQQIMVTTHNPLILNYLPDEKAKESVFFLYRNRYGATKATRFFEIPEVAQKLEVLGPGEAFLDTSLEELVECIENREVAA